MFMTNDVDLSNKKIINSLVEAGDTIAEYMIDKAGEFTDAYYSILIIDDILTMILEVYNYNKFDFYIYEEKIDDVEKEFLIEIYDEVIKK